MRHRMDARVDNAAIESPKLSVRNLNFYYGGFHALKNGLMRSVRSSWA